MTGKIIFHILNFFTSLKKPKATNLTLTRRKHYWGSSSDNVDVSTLLVSQVCPVVSHSLTVVFPITCILNWQKALWFISGCKTEIYKPCKDCCRSVMHVHWNWTDSSTFLDHLPSVPGLELTPLLFVHLLPYNKIITNIFNTLITDKKVSIYLPVHTLNTLFFITVMLQTWNHCWISISDYYALLISGTIS